MFGFCKGNVKNMKKLYRVFLLFLITVCVTAFLFSGCKKEPAASFESTEGAPESTECFAEESAPSESILASLPPETTAKTSPVTENTKTTAPATKTETTSECVSESAASESSTKYERTGESVFTDDPSNKYINAVAVKYNVDSGLLAAVYTIPDADGNMVMEFDGTKDENGKLLRNADTLVAIYTVDKSLNSKRASNDKRKNEYSTIESKTMFFSVTKYIIPKFENELNGK